MNRSRYRPALILAFGLAGNFGLATPPAHAAGSFVQIYIDAHGGCATDSPLTYVLVGQDIRTPFGKAAADWTDDDLAVLKTTMAACVAVAARRGNPYTLANIERDTSQLLARVPKLVERARDDRQAELRQLEARRETAQGRLAQAAKAKEQAKDSADAEVTALEAEAARAEADLQRAVAEANRRVMQATSDLDEAKAKVADARGVTAPRRASGELSELETRDAAMSRPSRDDVVGLSVGTSLIALADTLACDSLDHLVHADPQAGNSTGDLAAQRACFMVAKGTTVRLHATHPNGDPIREVCVEISGQADCRWIMANNLGAANR